MAVHLEMHSQDETSWSDIGGLWDLPRILQAGRFPLTSWELGAAQESGCNSILPLRISTGASGEILVVPTSNLLGVDWCRGPDHESLPFLVYLARPRSQTADGYEYSWDSMQGLLCYGTGLAYTLDEPQAPSYPGRMKLYARRLCLPWQRQGTVSELEDIMREHPPQRYSYAVDWSVGPSGWHSKMLFPAIREVAVRTHGRAAQLVPREGEVAWMASNPIASVEAPRFRLVFSDDPNESPDELGLVMRGTAEPSSLQVVLGREMFANNTELGCDGWHLLRQPHGQRRYTSSPTPSFAGAAVFVKLATGS